jgi:hypothetical protein
MAARTKNSGSSGKSFRTGDLPTSARLGSAAWIDAEHGLAFTVTAMPRIRDALVLRQVAADRTGRGRSHPDASGAR